MQRANTCMTKQSSTTVGVSRGASTYQALRVCSMTMGQEGLVRWPPVGTTLPVFPIYQPALQCHDKIDIQGRLQKPTSAKCGDTRCIRASGGPIRVMTQQPNWQQDYERSHSVCVTKDRQPQLYKACAGVTVEHDRRCLIVTHQVKLFRQVGTTQKLLDNMRLFFAHGISQHPCVVAFLHSAALRIEISMQAQKSKIYWAGCEEAALSCT